MWQGTHDPRKVEPALPRQKAATARFSHHAFGVARGDRISDTKLGRNQTTGWRFDKVTEGSSAARMVQCINQIGRVCRTRRLDQIETGARTADAAPCHAFQIDPKFMRRSEVAHAQEGFGQRLEDIGADIYALSSKRAGSIQRRDKGVRVQRLVNDDCFDVIEGDALTIHDAGQLRQSRCIRQP